VAPRGSLTARRSLLHPLSVALDVRGCERLYATYLAWLRRLRMAIHRGDCEALREIELDFGGLEAPERRVLAMAVHDVAGQLPHRAKVHFVRTLAALEDPGATLAPECGADENR
jgi:hypothetical protein